MALAGIWNRQNIYWQIIDLVKYQRIRYPSFTKYPFKQNWKDDAMLQDGADLMLPSQKTSGRKTLKVIKQDN